MGKFENIIQGDKPVLVDFFASWCGPCKMMQPILDRVKKELGDGVRIVKLDIDNPANRALVEKHNVRSVPTLMVYSGGGIVWRGAGVTPAEELVRILNGAAGK